jgi:hypothetical protein
MIRMLIVLNSLSEVGLRCKYLPLGRPYIHNIQKGRVYAVKLV